MNLHNCECSHTSLQLEIPQKLMYIFMIENVTSRLSGRLLAKGIISKFNTHTAKNCTCLKNGSCAASFLLYNCNCLSSSYLLLALLSCQRSPLTMAYPRNMSHMIFPIVHHAFHYFHYCQPHQCPTNQPRVRDVSKLQTSCWLFKSISSKQRANLSFLINCVELA